MNRHPLTHACFLLSVWLLSGCQNAERDARVWRATDHDRGDSPAEAPRANEAVAAPAASPALPSSGSATASKESTSPHRGSDGVSASAMRTWAGQCMVCHGQIGAGDGPSGPATGARNLTDPAWQAAASDAQIADSIRRGRGQMPPFALDAETVDGLVHLIRQMSARPSSPSVPTQAPNQR